MPTARYYQDQARLLFKWAQARASIDPEQAQRLEARGKGYLVLAAEAELNDQQPAEDTNIVPIAQQQQIQPEKEDE